MNTKEKILYESLELFSQRGYEGVSMRNIAKEVNIKESSIYKHYENKQAILDSIVCMAKERINDIYIKLDIPDLKGYGSIERFINMEIEDIAKISNSMMLTLINDEIVSKFRKLLTIEQFRNEEFKKIFVEFFIDRPIKYQEKIFQYLLDKNILKGENPEIMAIEIFSPFFMLQYKFDQNNEMLVKLLEEHTINFIKKYIY